MVINNNKGMYVEQLVDRTINFFDSMDLGIIEKRQLPIKVLKHINETTIIAKLTSKAKVDYFGYVNNKYFEMECKQTIHEYFDVLLIRNHQLEYLRENSLKKNCWSYILIYFEKYDKFIALTYQQLMKCKTLAKKNTLPYNIVVEQGIEIDVEYPGILNLKKLFF